jgi:hypothetical protein
LSSPSTLVDANRFRRQLPERSIDLSDPVDQFVTDIDPRPDGRPIVRLRNELQTYPGISQADNRNGDSIRGRVT